MYEILDDTLDMLETGREFALVTLVADQGSTPRAAGAEMLVRGDGSIAGSIGGGLLEHRMMSAAADALAERRCRRVWTELGGTDVRSAEKMLCGGAAEVLIAYVSAGDAALLEVCAQLREARDAGRRAWYVTVLPTGEDGGDGIVRHCAFDADGRRAGAAVCDAAEVRSLAAGAAVHGATRLTDGRGAVVERLDPPALAVVCGAGHVGRALAPVLLGLGFRVVVIDDREEFAAPARFPGQRLSPDRSMAPWRRWGGRARLRRDRDPWSCPRHGGARAGPPDRRPVRGPHGEPLQARAHGRRAS